jgi:hypothetical protein
MKIPDTILESSFMSLYGLVLLVSLRRYPRYYDSPLKFFPVLLMYGCFIAGFLKMRESNGYPENEGT